MARIKIDLPRTFGFIATIPVRITDLNYGGHVGNDTILSIIHEARMQYLRHYGYTELQFAGAGLIMSDAAISFKSELFYGDIVTVGVAIGDLSKFAFELYYKLEKQSGDGKLLVAAAKTGMVCYDYTQKKIVPVPPEIQRLLL